MPKRLELQDLDEKKSQIAHGETVRETATMISFMADVIGIRDDTSVQEIAAVHTLKIEAVQLLDELGKLSVHGNVLSKDETIAMSRCAPACACG